MAFILTYKCFLFQFFNNHPELSRNVRESTLREALRTLIMLLAEKRFEFLDPGTDMFVRVVNNVIIRVLDKSEHTAAIWWVTHTGASLSPSLGVNIVIEVVPSKYVFAELQTELFNQNLSVVPIVSLVWGQVQIDSKIKFVLTLFANHGWSKVYLTGVKTIIDMMHIFETNFLKLYKVY